MSETNETNGVAGVIDVVSLYPKDMNIYGDSATYSPSPGGSRCTGMRRASTRSTRATRGRSTWT